MKMLKKAAAVLLAAAMSLVMLTACGGGSGSSSLTAQALGDKYTVKYTLVERNGEEVTNGRTTTIMTDGTRFYEGRGEYATLETADGSYEINVAKKKAFKDEESSDMKGTLSAASVISSTGKKEYKGKTYITETATFTVEDGKASMTYCFYNGQMEYIMQEFTYAEGTYTVVYHVDSLVKSVDESVLDIKNYDVVTDISELYGTAQ